MSKKENNKDPNELADDRWLLELSSDKRYLLHRVNCNLNGILNELAAQTRIIRGESEDGKKLGDEAEGSDFQI